MSEYMSDFEQRCPRLYRAHRDELVYQERRRREIRAGILSPAVMYEELRRSNRRLIRHATFQMLESLQSANDAIAYGFSVIQRDDGGRWRRVDPTTVLPGK